MAATGFDSLVTDRANRMRWPHGRLRYYVAMLAELSQLRLLPFRMVLDGTKEVDADITLAALGNTRSYGGGLLICPEADYTDGLLDITMVHEASRTKLVRLFPTVMKGTHVNLDEVSMARAKTITSNPPASTSTQTATSPARCRPRSRRCRARSRFCGRSIVAAAPAGRSRSPGTINAWSNALANVLADSGVVTSSKGGPGTGGRRSPNRLPG